MTTKPPSRMWVLIDRSNSNERSKNYLWWFETRAMARARKARHDADPERFAKLDGPYVYYLYTAMEDEDDE